MNTFNKNFQNNQDKQEPLSTPFLLSMKKCGLSALLFKNEDRRDFHSFSLQNQQEKSLAHTAHTMRTHTNAQVLQTQKNKAAFSLYQADTPVSHSKENRPFTTTANFTITSKVQSTIAPYSPSQLHTQAPRQQTQIQASASAQNSQGEQPKKNKILPFSVWPESWKVMHERFSLPKVENTNSQVRVGWTYEGLEQDALGVANKARQDIMKQLLRSLNHKKGTHAFIPYSLPAENAISSLAMHENATFFWSAMRLFKPRILLVFGSNSRDELGLVKLRPLQRVNMGALMVLQMHKPETLAQDPTHYAACLAFLQNSLRMCAIK